MSLKSKTFVAENTPVIVKWSDVLEAVKNLRETVKWYFDDEDDKDNRRTMLEFIDEAFVK